MNIKKIVSMGGVPVMTVLSCLSRLQKSRMTLEEAHRIVANIYNIDKDDLDFVGGGENAPRLQGDELDISFVIPVYNSDEFLERCVRSILDQQTSARYEVICINDGSNDGSLSILERLKLEYKNLVVVSQENRGISATRNRGIELARGKYVGFVDNDDFVVSGYVEKLWKKCLETDADMIQVGYKIVDVKGNLVFRKTRPSVFIDGDRNLIQQNVSGYVWSGLHRKRVFEKLRFPIGFWYEDMITKMLLSRLCHKYVFMEDCLYNKTTHTGNASLVLWNSNKAKCIDHLYLIKKFAEYGSKELGLANDESLWLSIQNELRILWTRTKGMDRKVREALFVLGGALLRQYQITPPYM